MEIISLMNSNHFIIISSNQSVIRFLQIGRLNGDGVHSMKYAVLVV